MSKIIIGEDLYLKYRKINNRKDKLKHKKTDPYFEKSGSKI